MRSYRGADLAHCFRRARIDQRFPPAAAPEIAAARSAFREDLEGGVFWLKPLPVVVFEKARQIARKRTASLGTRTLDVLHVASALVLGATKFYTFDRNQSKLAAMEGLRVL